MRLQAVLARLLSFIVPAARRAEWSEEWLAELDAIARQRGTRVAARAAAGMVADALAVRRVAAGSVTNAVPGKVPMRSIFAVSDFKLGMRMLARYPGLTIVGVLGMAVGITIAAGAFTIVSRLMDPALPFEEGDRIVALGTWDVRTNNQEPRVLHEFASWRSELRSVEEIGAVRMVTRNLIAGSAQPEPVSVAEISASAFRVTRTAAVIGRTLLADDERPGAADVVVIGDGEWRRRFAADPAVLEQQLQLGNRSYAIVGVMPEGYGFPVAHSFWVPLRTAAAYEPLTGPGVIVFGRLAPGATLEVAQAEVKAMGQRMSSAYPRTHEHLRARVLPYTHVFTDLDDPDGALALRAIQSVIVLLLVVVCVNVAILVYARTATRHGEIAIRSALGASRLRIVVQLFAEALLLAGVAALAALGLLAAGFRQLDAAIVQLGFGFPFWLEFGLSTEAAIYIAALTVFSAAIVGVVPAFKATGRRVQAGLQGLSAGSGSRMHLGTIWTLLIVAQVAIAVALLPASVYHAWYTLRFGVSGSTPVAGEFLSTDVLMERPTDVAPSPEAERRFRQEYAVRQLALERRLESEAAVTHVTFSATEPGGELAGIIEVEGLPNPARPVNYNIVEGSKHGYLARFNRVGVDYFHAFDMPILAGRGLGVADTGATASAVVVDRTFVDQLLGGHAALGRRFRYVGRSREAGEGNMVLDRWYEIVGVSSVFPPSRAGGEPPTPRIYHAAAAGDVYPVSLAVRVRGISPSAFGDRFREIGARVDPALQLRNLSTVEDAMRREQGIMRLIGFTLIGVIASVVALSAAGIYALMSFTVARRRKEIGIRAALGADPRRILAGIFSRAFVQLGAGAALGMVGAIAMEGVLEGELLQGNGAVILPGVALFMTMVGLLAALGPARRGLRLEPTDVLREE